MKTRKQKKGFTIVELVIVLAVVGVLAAILIPTFTNIVNKANVAADSTLVRELNNALALDLAETGKTKHETMTDALKATNDYGFDVSKISTKASKNKILWDSKNGVFCYLKDNATKVEYVPASVKEGDELPANDYHLWIISNTVDANYSTYLYEYEVTETTKSFTFTKGLDVGETEGLDILTYQPTTAGQKVTIVTNGGTLVVNDTSAGSEQVHYGTLSEAEVTTGTSCFYTHGMIAKMDLKVGKAVADSNGKIALIKASAGTKAEKVNGGIIYIPEGTKVGSGEDIKWTSETDVAQLTTLGYNVEGNEIVATEETILANSYKIGTKEELIQFRKDWNDGKINSAIPFVLTANIDISGENWTPIGNWKYPFNGTFDGNDKTISGLTADGTLGSDGVYNIGGTIGFGECFGFIGIVGEGNTEVKDLTFTGVNINLVNGTNVGAVIGYAPAEDKGYNGDYIDSVGTLTLSGVTASGEINAKKHVGGLVGDSRTAGNVTFTNCVNNINITSTPGGYTGGIIGYVNKSANLSFVNCKNNGNITVDGSGSTGVGALCSSDAVVNISITNCESNGNISSVKSVAGLINAIGTGTSSLSIVDSKVTGTITSTGDANINVLHGLTTCNNITLSGNTFAGIIEGYKGSEITGINANLNGATAPEGYAIANINKCEGWEIAEIDHDDNGDIYWYAANNVHPVGYVVYNTNGAWTQIEGKNIAYMEVGGGYYVFRVNGANNTITYYARYTENPETDYRTLSQHPNHGQYVVAA